MTASIATDLPEPDSPTIATTSPASTLRSMSSTALNGPAAVAKVTERLRISRRGIKCPTLNSQECCTRFLS